ncbi:putative monovalent cation/H+ antiporter subunit D [Rickettsia bellii str. RML An4]|uniref:Putative monovalent cation/H+ antiporter subunit D n=1 Tax=Rickettsia bellii str. RML An4 TaxID=1359193 RepID=A0A0F3QCP0_RICBE|nr:putative monovalent cation/H+ antiporter subunit D [Rickettsia bellii OSU 85-389]KJV89921.1 putative monovalent cation/H+ antiporter subunit D [Rickettsia bellii str. RML An4]
MKLVKIEQIVMIRVNKIKRKNIVASNAPANGNKICKIGKCLAKIMGFYSNRCHPVAWELDPENNKKY